jgi:hypothetical protein
MRMIANQIYAGDPTTPKMSGYYTYGLQHLANARLPYNFYRRTREVLNEEIAEEHGLSCIALAYLAISAVYGCSLVERKNCYETFIDMQRFTPIELCAMRQGDLVWLGRVGCASTIDFVPDYSANDYIRNWRKSPASHVAVYMGEQQNDGDYLLLHATHKTGISVIQPLQEILADGYQVTRISRLAITGATPVMAA